MNITQISKLISKNSDLNYKEISAVIMQFVEKSQELVYNGHEVKIKGLATFKIQIDKERQKKVFNSKNLITIPERFNLKIVRSADFVKKINNKPLG